MGVSRADKGGYIVHPDPIPPWNKPCNKHIEEGTNNQKEKLFKRGHAMSGVPIIKGINQLPKPPISIGITKKKIMIKP